MEIILRFKKQIISTKCFHKFVNKAFVEIILQLERKIISTNPQKIVFVRILSTVFLHIMTTLEWSKILICQSIHIVTKLFGNYMYTKYCSTNTRQIFGAQNSDPKKRDVLKICLFLPCFVRRPCTASGHTLSATTFPAVTLAHPTQQ